MERHKVTVWCVELVKLTQMGLMQEHFLYSHFKLLYFFWQGFLLYMFQVRFSKLPQLHKRVQPDECHLFLSRCAYVRVHHLHNHYTQIAT